jgi:IMP and pyridine-specific 5'-nucleotidase
LTEFKGNCTTNSQLAGGNDVFVDIGDKSWGVRACQRYFGGIDPSKTLHIGDQFLSAGANDFKVRKQSQTSIRTIK